jgi:uncharacterized protein with FMN-binding domain
MRRAVLALGGTVAGLAALFSYKTHVPTVTALVTPVTPSAAPSAAAPTMISPPATKPATTTPTAAAATTTTTTTKPATTTPASATPTTTTKTTAPAPPPSTTQAPAPPSKPSGTFTGQPVDTNYGPVQVQITVSNGKITQAQGDDTGGSAIGQNAIPQLDQEAVQAQSANIQGVSGATYTSQGYVQSLQQAIDAAHL